MTVGIYFEHAENSVEIFVVRLESLINFLISGNTLSPLFFAFFISFCTKCALIWENLSAKLEYPLRMIFMYSLFFKF